MSALVQLKRSHVNYAMVQRLKKQLMEPYVFELGTKHAYWQATVA